MRRLRSTIANCQNGVWGDEPDGIHDVVCIRVADFDRVTFRVNNTSPTLRSIEPKIFATRQLIAGDLLLEKSGGGDNQPVGAVTLYDHALEAVCSNFVARITVAAPHDAQYLTYLHAALYAQRINTRHIKQSTGIQNLDSSSYFREIVALPPASEQRVIASYLDRETSRIDALVAMEQRLIELLKERRTGLITWAVTKGVDANAPMKHSGLGWLGEIPAHWKIRRLKTMAVVQQSTVDKKSVEGEEAVQLCNYTDVYYHERITKDLEFMRATATPQQVRRFSLRAGDVIITKDSESWTDIAVAAVVTDNLPNVLCGYHLAHIRPDDSCDGAFLARAFSAIGPRDQFQIAANGITRFGLSGDAITTGLFAVPPLPEQRTIVAFLNRETERIDALIDKAREAIERLKELRTALISAAVTGRIDVRGGIV
jgi:type I restriction enzyme S subunit